MKQIYLCLLILLACPVVVSAQSTQPTIILGTDIEDGKKMIHAMVTVGEKPLANMTLQFFAKRTFGNILLGEDTTVDDGSAAVAFPATLPGSSDRQIHLIVKVKAPAQYTQVTSESAFPSNVQMPLGATFPRALWAPRAPVALTTTIFLVLAAIWCSYAFVVGQIVAIRRGGK